MRVFQSHRDAGVPARRSSRSIVRIALAGAALAAVTAGSVLVVKSVSEASAQGQRQEGKPAAKPGTPAAKAAEAKTAEAKTTGAKTAEAPPAAPVRTETIVYDQWTVMCHDRLDGSVRRTCNAILKVVDPSRNQVVLAWMIARGADSRIETVIQTPTGVQVQRGLTLKLGERAPRTISFTSCEPQNCEAGSQVDAAMLRDMQASPQAVATIYAKDGRGIQFTLPLGGIEKALSAVQS
jgi:invasion protein IalB